MITQMGNGQSPKLMVGQFSPGRPWRVLVLLSPGDRLGLVGMLGSDLARANRGELYIGVIYEGDNPVQQSMAQATLNELQHTAVSTTTPDLEVESYLLLEKEKADNYKDILHDFIKANSIDLILIRADSRAIQYIHNLPCPFGVLRGEQKQIEEPQAITHGIQHILVPTAGGPNTIASFEFLLPLATRLDKDITALYVARDTLNEEEVQRGEATLNKALNIIDANEHVKQKVIVSNSVIDSLTEESAKPTYDLVVIGANESAVERLLFGNIVDSVVREGKTPVLVVRQPNNSVSNLANRLFLRARGIVPQLNTKKRTEVYMRIRRSSRPSTDFYVLITLSAAIAALGLILNSPAVVIGAMLVAPLMSPIVGVGMAMVYGDTRFLRIASLSVGRGVALAFFVGVIIGLFPFNQDLTAEIMARTTPTIPDLGVALFSGLAGAYALCYSQAAGALPGVAIAAALVPPIASSGIALSYGRWEEALGAMLLFLTNLVAVSLASAFVFILLGFRPIARKQKQATRVRSVRLALIFLAINVGILSFSTISLTREQRELQTIRTVTSEQLAAVTEASMSELEINFAQENNERLLELEITARSARAIIPYAEVVQLQEQIASNLEDGGVVFDKLALNLVVIRVTQLDPSVPPTLTPTAVIVLTPTAVSP